MTTVSGSAFGSSTVLGYPRIGPRRELKRALEDYWDRRSSAEALRATGARLRAATWQRLGELGLAAIPSGTFSFYDHVLDTALLLDAVPERYRNAGGALDTGFAMARGTEDLAPLPMTKWFDTNYHYLVPEIGSDTAFRLAGDQPVAEVREARALGHHTRPVLLGPVTFLLLSQPAPGSPPGFAPLDRLDDLLPVYGRLLAALAAVGVGWVQLDEPVLVADRTPAELAAVRSAYEYLGGLARRPRLFVATYFGDTGEAYPVLAAAPVEAIGLDLVRGRVPDPPPANKTLVAGIVSGRDVWRTDLDRALARLRPVAARVGELVVGTSCPLLHVPYNLDLETGLDPALARRLAFAEQKVAEVVALAGRLATETGPAPAPVPPAPPAPPAPAPVPPVPADGPERARLPEPARRSPYPERAAAQAAHLDLPALPVTTIGSFPQTGELRAARAALRAGRMAQAGYERLVEAEITRVIRFQEQLGVDVLVHGEPERNDMVQYFAEHLDGFAITSHGWVQSYGSRCTRPPILYDDVRRAGPITLRWTRYAQSLTDRPVKGMLTGPVTIVAWSFVRDDAPLPEVVGQVAEAIGEEVRDLAAAGTSIIQVDEPALRELMPLRASEQDDYLRWAVAAYRRATATAGDGSQIHTHLCYSDAGQVLAAIDGLDADVTTIESARSGARILAAEGLAQFARGLGPGVYDIHSPRVPRVAEVAGLIEAALRMLPAERVWVNPDCGLKTRAWPEVEAALRNLVAARDRVAEKRLSAGGQPALLTVSPPDKGE